MIRLFCICMLCLTMNSCVAASGMTYDRDNNGYLYITTNYYDNINGISVIYINNKPYYQCYDHYHGYWYRKPVPNYRHKHIVRRSKPNINRHRPIVSRPGHKPNKPKPHNRREPKQPPRRDKYNRK